MIGGEHLTLQNKYFSYSSAVSGGRFGLAPVHMHVYDKC